MIQLSQTSKAILRNSNRILAGTVFASFTVATYYRPLPDNKSSDNKQSNSGGNDDDASKTNHHLFDTNTNSRKSSQALFCSPISYESIHRNETPLLLSIARTISISITTIAIRLLMNTYGSYQILNTQEEEYNHFLSLVLDSDGRSKRGEGLITVSNHRSLFDDPGVISCLLPLWIGIRPKYNRWGICSQEYCFNDMLPAPIKGYIGAGQVLPICRGGGIDQKLLRDFATFLARGEWCHIFPEGGVWQIDELGGRGFGGEQMIGRHQGQQQQQQLLSEANLQGKENSMPESTKLGKLKWGVGKLIAHAPVRPRVVPFAHVGMENLLPQDPETGRTYLKKQLFGGEPLKVRIKVGKEITFDDLIQKHEEQHGKLWTYENTIDHKKRGQWKSSTEEKKLYHEITLRIEKELDSLTKEITSTSQT